MSDEQLNNSDMNDTTKLNRDGVRGIAREVAWNFINFSVLLIAGGNLYWINAWVILALGLGFIAINSIVLATYNPQILNERGKIVQEDTKNFDQIFVLVYVIIALVTTVIVGLDAMRYKWTSMPLWLNVVGLVLFVVSCTFGGWTMKVNRFFETTVRIQDNRGHQVCSEGPYKIVRHPGYTATIIGAPAYPMILGSWWGMLAIIAYWILFTIRTSLEDKTLQEELPGYKEFAQTTRYRLIPYIW